MKKIKRGGSQGAVDMREKVVGSGIVVPGTAMSIPSTWSSMSQAACGPPAHPPGVPGPGPCPHSSCYSSWACSQEEFRRTGFHRCPCKKAQSGCKGFKQVHRTSPGSLSPSPPIAPTPPLFYHGAGECRSLQIWPPR